MKKRNIMTIILAGFIIIPIFIALYKVDTSFNLPIPLSTMNSFQLSSSISFQSEFPISPQNTDYENISSKIAVDSNNIIHVVYSNSSNGIDIWYLNSTKRCINSTHSKLPFKNVTRISTSPNPDETPALAVDKDNRIYIVWQTNDSVQKDIVIANSSDFFSTNFTISPNDTFDDITPDIAIDSNKIVHIVWAGPSNITGTDLDIWYTNSSNYTNSIIISNNSNDDITPCIDIDSNNVVHVAWAADDGTSYNIWYVNSTNNFQSNMTISNNPDNDDKLPDITVSDSIFITWMGSNGSLYDIWLANSTNFSVNRTISQNPYNDTYPRLVNGPGDIIHVVWSAFNGSQYDIIYWNRLDLQSNTTITSSSEDDTRNDIGLGNNGRVHITWIVNNTVFYINSTYPSSPAVKLLKYLLLPMELNKPGTAMLAYGEFYDEFYIDKVEIMWSTNTGVSWNRFLMFGSGNGTKWKGTGFIPGYQYGVVLLYKFKITDKAGQDHETAQKIFYYPDTRIESIVLIIILFGVLGTLTALYLIPQTRNFFGKLFSRKESGTIEKSKKPEVEKVPES